MLSDCPLPYLFVIGVGCLHVVKEISDPFTYYEAKSKCNDQNSGFLFEFKDFAAQHSAVAEFLFTTTGAGIDFTQSSKYSSFLFWTEENIFFEYIIYDKNMSLSL